jgi:hypothetical protein
MKKPIEGVTSVSPPKPMVKAAPFFMKKTLSRTKDIKF